MWKYLIIISLILFCGCATNSFVREHKKAIDDLNHQYDTGQITLEEYNRERDRIHQITMAYIQTSQTQSMYASQGMQAIGNSFLERAKTPQKTYIYPTNDPAGRYSQNALTVEETR